MLVLTRKTGEQVIIADNIKVTIVSVGPGRVKIGIEAPHDVSVDRAEVYDKKLAERSGATVPADPVGPPVPAADAPETLVNRIAAKLPSTPMAPVPTAVPLGQTPPPVPARAIHRPAQRLPRKPR